MKVTPEQRDTPPDNPWTVEVCKRGQGADTCRFLSMMATGWSCERRTQVGAYISQRAERGQMVARSINCDGRAASRP